MTTGGQFNWKLDRILKIVSNLEKQTMDIEGTLLVISKDDIKKLKELATYK